MGSTNRMIILFNIFKVAICTSCLSKALVTGVFSMLIEWHIAY